ncbi:hypothetical protein MMC31_002322 [Peltigera leucophlebia]|nr:hypothetical protein [Peltigera leucophlebia]
MQWKRYAPLLILWLISSLSLVLNIYRYQGIAKARNEILEELVELKNKTTDLCSQVRRLQDSDKILRQEIISLTEDAKISRLKWRPVKKIRIHYKKQVSSISSPYLYSLALEIPVEDAALLLSYSQQPQPMASSSSFIETMNIIHKDEIRWQENFRIDPSVMEIPFTDWALVWSYGPKRTFVCGTIFDSLTGLLPMPISSSGIIFHLYRKEAILWSGEAPDYVEIGIDIPGQQGLEDSYGFILAQILKLYPKEQEIKPISGLPLKANLRIELETYEGIIRTLGQEARRWKGVFDLEDWRTWVRHWECPDSSVYLRLESIDRSGNAVFRIEREVNFLLEDLF